MALTAGGNEGTTNGTTDVTVVSAPSTGQRIVRTITVYNVDSGSATVTLKKVVGASEYIIVKIELISGKSLIFGEPGECIVLDATNETVKIVLAAAVGQTELDFTAAYATQT